MVFDEETAIATELVAGVRPQVGRELRAGRTGAPQCRFLSGGAGIQLFLDAVALGVERASVHAFVSHSV